MHINLVCDRSTRESTPSSLIRDPDIIRTPGSTTRPTNSADTNRRIQNSSQRHIPTANEMDEFFAVAEVEQQKQFIDKYATIFTIVVKFRSFFIVFSHVTIIVGVFLISAGTISIL